MIDETGNPKFIKRITTKVTIKHNFLYGDGREAEIEFEKIFSDENDKMRIDAYLRQDACIQQETANVFKTSFNVITERVQ